MWLGVVGLGWRPLFQRFMVRLCLPTQAASEVSPTEHTLLQGPHMPGAMLDCK